MKRLLSFCLIFVALTNISFGGAKTCTGPEVTAFVENDVKISSSLEDNSVEIQHCAFLTHPAVKARPQRTGAEANNFETIPNVLIVRSANHSTIPNSSLYLSFIRLLLYPKHYFW